MNNDPLPDVLAQRLQAEADELLRDSEQHADVAVICVSLRHRAKRRRTVTRSLQVAASAAVLCVVAFVIKNNVQKPNEKNVVHPVVKTLIVAEPGRVETGNARNPSVVSVALENQAIRSTDGEPIGKAQSVLVPILVHRSDGTNDLYLTPGFYVPPHTERIDLQRLSPAEKQAVTQVLGLDSRSATDDPI